MRTETRLDYATFQLDEARTRCELWVTAGNETEKLASGSLKPFLTHLHEAQKQIGSGQTSVRLQVPSVLTGRTFSSSWFTKGTIERFVRFVTTPDVLERVSIVETERRQLEEAISILAVGDQQSKQTHGSVGLEGEDVIDGDATGDGSKNQLLMAMDARRIMLQKEQLNAFARAAAAGFEIGCMADLMDFAECFGASRFREACFKFAAIYKKMQEKGQLVDLEVDAALDTGEDSFQKNSRARRTWGAQDKSATDHLHQSRVETISDTYEEAFGTKSIQGSPYVAANNADSQSASLYGSPSQSQDFRAIPDSPPNIMDAQSPSTEGTNSQQETPTSRRLPRRASSPRRRSSSPLRKVQIGRSGSRRPGLVVIRNINYASSNLQDSTKTGQSTEANDSTDESESVHESEHSKVERHRRLSVQDAISLFERRQRDLVEAQTVKVEARRASMDPTGCGKSVLRRWSGISDKGETAGSCGNTDSSMSTPDQVHAGKSFNLPEQHVSSSRHESVQEDSEARRKSWMGTSNDLEWKFQQLKIQEAALPPVRNLKDSTHNANPISPKKAADMQFGFQYRGQRSRGPLSKSWTATSEQDLLSLVHKAEIDMGDQHKARVPGRREDQGRFYEQYREIRDAKIRQESELKRAERESKLRAMQEVLERRKAELVAGSGRAAEKSHANTTERQDKLQASRASSMKKTPQGNIKTPPGRPTSRSSPTLPSSQSTATTPRAIRQQLPVEPKSNTARKLSPSAQKSVSGTTSGRVVTSSPKSITRNSGAPTQRRPGSSTQLSAYGNPLSRSMPSLSELRKENTRPATRSGAPAQQNKVAPAKHSQSKPGASGVRHRSVNKVMPLEPNGVIPSDCVLQVPEDRTQTALKKKPSPASVEDSQVLTPRKVDTSPRIPVHMSQETKPFLRKGRGIGPGAGPGVMKLKAAVASEADEDQTDTYDDSNYPSGEAERSSLPLVGAQTLESQDPVGASYIEPEGFSGSVRESQEMDIDIQTTSNETLVLGDPKRSGDFEGTNIEIWSANRTLDPVEVDGTLIALQDGDTNADGLVAPIQDSIITLGTSTNMVSNVVVPTPGLQLDSALGSSPMKLTLMQQLASDEYAELAQLTGLCHTSTNDRRASLASVGSSSPCSSPASGIPHLRHSISPDVDGAKYEIAQSRKKWGGSQKPVPINSQPVSKEAPKGFKRLLKFGRKSRGSGSNTTEWVSASTTSEGDEDTDESRDTGYSNGTTILRRSTESFPKEADVVNGNGSRSFFSLSSFRSKGSSESKSRF